MPTQTNTNVVGTNEATGTNATNTNVTTNANLSPIPEPDATVDPLYTATTTDNIATGSSNITGTVDPSLGSVDPDSLVQNRMSGLLSEGSSYLDAAQTNALKTAASRGLLNTSMAATAGTDAAIKSALPIAQQDANTYETQNLTNQQVENQFLGQTHGADLNAQLAQENAQAQADLLTHQANLGEQAAQANQVRGMDMAQYQTELNRLQAEDSQAYQLEIQSLNHQNQQEMMALEEHLKEQLAALQQDYAIELQTLKSQYALQGNLDTVTGALYGDTLKSLASFLNSPDLSAAQQTAGANNIINNLKAGLQFLTGITGAPGTTPY